VEKSEIHRERDCQLQVVINRSLKENGENTSSEKQTSEVKSS